MPQLADSQTEVLPTVLVVDDEPINCALAEEILHNEVHVLTVYRGIDALEIVHQQPVDLILLDMLMPGMDGYEVCRRLKADEKTKDIPVIFFTAYGSEESEEKGFSLGAVDFVNKPPVSALLRARVSTQIRLYRAQAALARRTEVLEQRVEERTRALRHSYEAEAKRAQEVAHLMTELESMIRLAPVGIARLRERRFVSVNEAFGRMLGYEGTELIGQSTRLIYRSDAQYEQLGRDAYESLRRGEQVKFETELVTKGGEPLWALVGTCSANPQRADADVFYMFEDISRHHILENQLRAAVERTRALSQAKSEFLSIIGHELRTPLNGILGMARLLEVLVNPTDLEYVHSIRHSGDNLLTIINQILNFTSIDARPLEDSLECHSPFVTIALQTDPYKVKAQLEGLAFEMHISEALQEEALFDDRSLETVLKILLDNAAKFTDTGQIRLTANLEADKDGRHHVVCEIGDTGIGMDAETLGKLFTPFFQGANAITRKHGGVGLGLALARKLITRMDGSIDVQSVPERGTIVRFKMPLYDKTGVNGPVSIPALKNSPHA